MREPIESDLLLKIEQEIIPSYYKEYYKNKRHNFFATIQQFSYLWDCYISLDKIWQREFETMENLTDPNLHFPLTLYMSAHAKMRVAFELACSACLAEAHSVLRDAVEATAHGHRLALNPHLLEVWLRKDNDEVASKRYKQEFEEQKATRLFDGLPRLHVLWKQYSELGSHTNVYSMAGRFQAKRTDTHLQFMCNYTGGRPEVLAPALCEMILTFYHMEIALYEVCESRLKLDFEISQMRSKFHDEQERARYRINSDV